MYYRMRRSQTMVDICDTRVSAAGDKCRRARATTVLLSTKLPLRFSRLCLVLSQRGSCGWRALQRHVLCNFVRIAALHPTLNFPEMKSLPMSCDPATTCGELPLRLYANDIQHDLPSRLIFASRSGLCSSDRRQNLGEKDVEHRQHGFWSAEPAQRRFGGSRSFINILSAQEPGRSECSGRTAPQAHHAVATGKPAAVVWWDLRAAGEFPRDRGKCR